MRKLLLSTFLAAFSLPALPQVEKATPEIRKPSAEGERTTKKEARGQRDGERGSAAAGGTAPAPEDEDDAAADRRSIDPRTGQTPVEAKPGAEKPPAR